MEQVERIGGVPLAILILVIVAILASAVASPVMLVALIPIVAIGWVFSQMVIAIRGGVLIWHFRGGVWRKEIPLSEIATVREADLPWWFGWGIRRTPTGWLYSISGPPTVEIVTLDGRRIFLGSATPAAVAARIRDELSGRRRST